MISKSYQDVRVGTRKEGSLKTASDCADVCGTEGVGAGNWERPFADCRESRRLDDDRQKTAAIVLMSRRQHGLNFDIPCRISKLTNFTTKTAPTTIISFCFLRFW